MTRRDLLKGLKLVGCIVGVIVCIVGVIVFCALVLLGLPWLVVSFLAWNMNPAEWGDAYRAVAVVWFAALLLIIAGANS